MRTYTIIAGVNGVGKSSFTGVLKSERIDLGCIINADKIAADNKCSPLYAAKTAVNKINEYLSKEISFAQETTLSGQKTERTVKTAKENGYIIQLFYIGLNDSGECKKRIKNRVEKGGHNIADIDVERRFNSRFHSLAKILPYCDKTLLFDNENGFVEVGEYKNGELIPKGDYRPVWLSELRDYLRKV